MRIIVVGAGRTGRHIVELATADKNEIFVIEKDEKIAEEISKDFDCKVIIDDATSRDALKEAQAEEADGLITTTNDDAVNMLIMMIAKEMEVKNLVSSVIEESRLHLFEKMGVGTIDSPYRLNARHLYFSVKSPSVQDFLELGGGVEIMEFSVGEKSAVNGKTVKEIEEMDDWPEDSRVVVIRREDDIVIPQNKIEIKKGDSVVILSEEEKVDKINKLFEEDD